VRGFSAPTGLIRAGDTRMSKKTDPDRSKAMHLSDVLAAQRQRTEDAWFAATTEMQNDAWLAGRDKDRRVRAQRYEPERRRAVIAP
jgi:hypothetical protein